MATSATDESPPEDSTSLADKQERVRQVLWHCLKDPPRVEVTVGPGVLRVAAKFTTTSLGVQFDSVESGREKIVVAANLDPLTVQVNFEQLASLARLDSIEDASQIWESFKQEVSSIPFGGVSTDAAHDALAAPEQEPLPANEDHTIPDGATRSHESTQTLPVADKGEVEMAPPPAVGTATSQTTQFTGGSNLHQKLLTAAMDVRLAAIHTRLIKCEHDHEIASKSAAAEGASTNSANQRKKDTASKLAFLAIKGAKQALRSDWAHDNTEVQNTTTWFIQYLFGDMGLQNLSQHIRQSTQSNQSSISEANAGNGGQPIDLMDKVLQAYQKLVESDPDIEDSYLARFRLVVEFQEQHRTLWCMFLQADSTERQALLLQSKGEGLLTDSEDNFPNLHESRVLNLGWKWIERSTHHAKDTIVEQLYVSHHLKAMMKVLGRGVLYFMDKRLETRLKKLTLGRGVLGSLMKTVEVTIGKKLRGICEQGQAAILRRSAEPNNELDDIRQQLEEIAKSMSRHAVSNIDSLLEAVKRGQVNIPIFRGDFDDETADDEHEDFEAHGNMDPKKESNLGRVTDTQHMTSVHGDADMSCRDLLGDGSAIHGEDQTETSASQSGKRKSQGDDRGEDDTIEEGKQKRLKLTVKSKVSGKGEEGKKHKKTKGRIPDEDDTSGGQKRKKAKGKVPHEDDTPEGKKQKKTKDQISHQSPKKGPKKGSNKGSKESV